MRRFTKYLAPLLVAAVSVFAIRFIFKELQHFDVPDLIASIRKLPNYAIPLSLLATASTYLTLTLYDSLGVRYVGRALGKIETATISFIACVMSYNVGLSMLGGMAVRFRMYSVRGFTTEQITKLSFFVPYSFWVGFALVSSIAFLMGGIHLPPPFAVPSSYLKLAGIVLLGAWLAFLALSLLRKTPFSLRTWKIALPPPQFIPAQVAIATTEIVLASLAFYLLLPEGKPPLLTFTSIFMVATFISLVSHVPGGLGVFDTIILLSLRPYIEDVSIIGGLVAFRAIYFLLPLVIATAMLALSEWVAIRRGLTHVSSHGTRLAQMIAPRVLAAATLLSGISLLVTGATPILKGRLLWLENIFPLAAVEASHFFASIVGVVLLFQAHALIRRIDFAYYITLCFLGTGVLLSIVKAEFGAAFISALVLLTMLPCRRLFYRKSRILQTRISFSWIATVAAILASTAWLGFFAYRNVNYSSDLWWRVAYHADASRFLRSTTGAAVAILAIGIWQAFKSRQPRLAIATPDEIEKALPLVASAERSNANLLFLGDKGLLFSPTQKSAIMYGISGDVWIALGEPLGERSESLELIWRFREQCDASGDVPVFYNIGQTQLATFLEAGFSLSKIGEEAIIDLTTFSLEGGRRKAMRASISKSERLGCSFEIVSPENVPNFLPDLKAISDQWLDEKNASEKSFTLGSFKESYLKHFPFATIRQDGKIVAFANLWLTQTKREVSIDLMRHDKDAPSDTMHYLFAKIILWGQEQGFQRFNMGMAPLAGLEDHPLAPTWNRVGTFIFERGESFYNFQGLRQYKEKFDPEWAPRYIATLGGTRLPQALIEISRLSAGGWLQIFK